MREATDPVSKGTFFHLSTESTSRPEVQRHHDRLARLPVGDEVVVGGPSGDDADGSDGGETERWLLRPPFGPLPPALKDAYPLTAEVPERLEPQAYEAAAEGVARLAETNPDTTVRLVHDGWPESALDVVPDDVTVKRRDTGQDAPEEGEE
jgi:7-cyano-7-deazaguanine tRNA-ribosyltransferase